VDRFVADFIGDANLLKAEILGIDDGLAEVDIGGFVCNLPNRTLARGVAEVAVRPEAIRLMSGVSSETGFKGIVRRASYLGSHMEYEVETALGGLFVTDYVIEESLAEGVPVSVSILPGGVTLIGGGS